MMSIYRTNTCAELRKADVGKTVRLAGWIHSVRDHGGVIFIDLRDHYGMTQIVVDPEREFYRDLDHWRVESVVSFSGKVVARSENTVNPRLATGEIEVVAEGMEMLGEADVIPFQVAKDDSAPEALRLKYRFLDLRNVVHHKTDIAQTQDHIVVHHPASGKIRLKLFGFSKEICRYILGFFKRSVVESLF